MSDIHAYSGQLDSAPSLVSTSDAAISPRLNPLDELISYVDKRNFEIDLILCCGDICNHADPQGLSHAWDRLQTLATTAQASLIATVGNHDLDSRFNYSDHDPKAALQLLPSFPFDDVDASDRYWARNYAVVANNKYRVVTLNSSAYHGYIGGDQHEREHTHGRVSEATIHQLRSMLSKTSRAAVNILMCHHHPVKLGQIDADDYSEMKKGHLLVQLLADDGPWMIVHGHKHFPFLQYASGDSESPVIFTAGSLSASIFAEAQGHARNQFYIIEFAPEDQLDKVGLTLAGSIRAWDWTPAIGWTPAQPTPALRHLSGFGMRRSIVVAAKEIQQIVAAENAFMSWEAILAKQPDLKYMLPTATQRLIRELETGHQISTIARDTGEIYEVGPKHE